MPVRLRHPDSTHQRNSPIQKNWKSDENYENKRSNSDLIFPIERSHESISISSFHNQSSTELKRSNSSSSSSFGSKKKGILKKSSNPQLAKDKAMSAFDIVNYKQRKKELREAKTELREAKSDVSCSCLYELPFDSNERNRHSFISYGWNDASDVSAKKTFNVKISAGACYIHPSALRAKFMRDKEKPALRRKDQVLNKSPVIMPDKFYPTKSMTSKYVWKSEYQDHYINHFVNKSAAKLTMET